MSIGDLRAGASLILAALAADGESVVHGAHHVQRGYEHIDRKFGELGARIVRTADPADRGATADASGVSGSPAAPGTPSAEASDTPAG